MGCCGRGVLVGNICFKDKCDKYYKKNKVSFESLQAVSSKLIDIQKKLEEMSDKLDSIEKKLNVIEDKL